jgi:transposase-like protein
MRPEWFMERRRTFSREFKLEAVGWSPSVAVVQAAKDLDVRERAAQVGS